MIARPLLLALLVQVGFAAPADKLPDPTPEPCIPFEPDMDDDYGMAAPSGLGYAQVRNALNGVIQTALYCGQPEGMSEVHLTFDLMVGCDGVVDSVETVDDGNAPADYVACISSVIAKADFDAHDMENGMLVTYPVDVSWAPPQ